jgi:hypothetical protein
MRVRTWTWLCIATMGAALMLPALEAACGSNGADDGSAMPTGALDDGGAELVVVPDNPVIDVDGPGTPKQAFHAILRGMETSATWSVGDPSFGTIDTAGVFSPSGLRGGAVAVTAQVGSLSAFTDLTLRVHIVEGAQNVDAATQAKLRAGGTADPGFGWLYPYDRTVWPRGLVGPTLQWKGAAPDALYVHVTSHGLDYQGYFKGAAPSRLDLPDATWKTITESASGKSDPVKIEVTKISAGRVSGPISETWTIAPGSLHGTVYYNSYTSKIAGGPAVLRIKPGAKTPEVVLGGSSGCVVCHSVSADGSTLVAGHAHDYDAVHDLKNGAQEVSRQAVNANDFANHVYTFAALYPDGSMLMSCDTCGDVYPQNNNRGPSALYDTKSGAQIAAPGFDGVVTAAAMPSFAPDGSKLVFNPFGQNGPGHTLSIMDFDAKTHRFSNRVDMANNASLIPSWPSFTPDNTYVLYHLGTHTYTLNVKDPKSSDSTADLNILHVGSKTTAPLDALNGMAGGEPYLPYGAAEAHFNFEPTMLPVASGGYYWVVFTSRREYGNTITDPDAYSTLRKKLWVAALDIAAVTEIGGGGNVAADISHPAFYLPGQELEAGNMRAFWALDPCKAGGNACGSGDECCTGYCRATAGGAATCVAAPTGCSKEFEKCTTSADCCSGPGSMLSCIGGHCATTTQDTPPPILR